MKRPSARLEKSSDAARRPGNTARLLAAAVMSAILLIVMAFSMDNESSKGASMSEPETMPAVPNEPPADPAAQDYSRFRHDTAQHKRMPCLVCHVRNDNRTTPKFPGHIPCSSCHSQEFRDNKHPICVICHTPTSVKPFPRLRSFRTVFDHSKHSRLANCADCHRPVSRGAAMTVPTRLNAHSNCFQCHGPQARSGGRDIASCATCHQAGRPNRFSQSSAAARVNFSHSEHTSKRISCSECHTVRAGAATGRQVSSPLLSMHLAPARTRSCAACHNDKRAFGDNNFTSCKRCHEGSTFRF